MMYQPEKINKNSRPGSSISIKRRIPSNQRQSNTALKESKDLVMSSNFANNKHIIQI